MWLGAVYGRYHYLLDILVGGILGVFSVILADQVFGTGVSKVVPWP
jgi:membrane-associated phospholipid phosphatase